MLADLEKCYGREDVLKELRKHNKAFDFEKFYADNIGISYVLQTGFRLISRNQMIDCFCAPYSNRHEYIIENILYAMFDDYNDVFRKNKFEWRNTCSELGVIAFQLISKNYSLIWMPKKINKFQYNAFLETYETICKMKSEGFLDVLFLVNFHDDECGYKTFSLDDSLNYIKTIVCDDDFCYDEYMLEDGKKLVKE